MNKHNLSTVIWFEIIRTLKKKSFWISALLFPVAMAGIFGIIFFSNQATEEAAKDTEKQKFSIIYSDESGAINPQIASAIGAQPVTDKNDAIARVKAGEVDSFFYYPQNLSRSTVEVYAKDVGLFDNGRYGTVAQVMLEQSVNQSVSEDIKATLQKSVTYSASYYKDGALYDGFKQIIAPGLFLVIFYMLIAMFSNQMLTSTTEEKENRVIEMILTTIKAETLIIGKIISLMVLSVIQMLLIIVPAVIGYLALHDQLSMPSLDLSSIPLDPVRILVGLILFVFSYVLFTGLLVTIGAATPTAKEAGSFFGVVMMLIFGPLYAAPLFISTPNSPLVQFLTYFPLTSPIPALLRNAVGNLTTFETIVTIAILSVTSIIVIKIAIQVFRYGALEYSRRLTIKEIFGIK